MCIRDSRLTAGAYEACCPGQNRAELWKRGSHHKVCLLYTSFQNTDVSDNSDHDGGNHQRNRHKCDQNVADDINDIRNGGH